MITVNSCIQIFVDFQYTLFTWNRNGNRNPLETTPVEMYINVQKEHQSMISAAFTEFRKNTASFLDKVENGETVVITRHGRPIAEIVPPSDSISSRSWKRPAARVKIKGISLSSAVLEERTRSRA